MDEEDNGILNIEFSDDEVDVVKKKADRTGQSEEEFQAVKRDYRVRVENGEVWKLTSSLITPLDQSFCSRCMKLTMRQMYKHVELPVQPGTNKMRTQELIHAVEELYFFRQYQQGIDLIQGAVANGGAEALDNDSRQLLEAYEKKCQQKLATAQASS